MSRLKVAAAIINEEWKGDISLLDVGCRGKELKTLISPIKRYQGIDFLDSEDVLGHDVETPIPFGDESFDVVTALDVVEHVENAHQLLAELLRIASKAVIVSLPNMYYWKFRLKFLIGKELGGKYIFPVSPVKDRHRWLPSYISAQSFIQGNSCGTTVAVIPVLAERKGKINKILNVVDEVGSKFLPNLFVYNCIFILRKLD